MSGLTYIKSCVLPEFEFRWAEVSGNVLGSRQLRRRRQKRAVRFTVRGLLVTISLRAATTWNLGFARRRTARGTTPSPLRLYILGSPQQFQGASLHSYCIDTAGKRRSAPGQKLLVGRRFVTIGCYFASKNEHASYSFPFHDAAATQHILVYRRPGGGRGGPGGAGQAAAGRRRCPKLSGVPASRNFFG